MSFARQRFNLTNPPRNAQYFVGFLSNSPVFSATGTPFPNTQLGGGKYDSTEDE